VLHPRGSEYDVQFVVDGVPLNENRSPAFAPNFESEDVESMRVFTAGSRRSTDVTGRRGGTFFTQRQSRRMARPASQSEAKLWLGERLCRPGLRPRPRPPVGQQLRHAHGPVSGSSRARQLHQHWFVGGGTVAYSRDISSRDRLRVKVSQSDVRFEVPNELVQQNAGQRQDRTNRIGTSLKLSPMIPEGVIKISESGML